MRVLQLTVRNFAPIMVAMKRSVLEIDFTKGGNLLTLLIGGNGTGKTTIGSLLHPFAYNGNIDQRENDLILPEEDGYKSITIAHQDHSYKMTHIYKYQGDKSRSVKSYFERDGQEMNENGNVSSFKSLVANYLGIDESYLKLTRLGANVSNIISMNSADRKEFMNKRLEELNAYGAFYRKTSEDLRIIKSLLKVNVDKLEKLNIRDVKLFEEQIEVLRKEIGSLEKERERLKKNYDRDNGKIEVFAPDGAKAFLQSIEAHETKIRALMNEYQSLQHQIDGFEDGEAILNGYTEAFESFHETMKAYNALLSRRDSLQTIIDSSQSIRYMDGLEEKKRAITSDIERYEKLFGDSKPNLPSSAQLREALVVLQGIEFNYHHLYEQPVDTIREIMSDSGGNLSSYLVDLQSALADAYNKDKGEQLRQRIAEHNDMLYIMVEPLCGFPQCTYRQFYQDMMEHNHREPSSEEWDTTKLSERMELAQYLMDFKRTVENAKIMLSRIPERYGTFEFFMERIMAHDSIIAESHITDYINLMEQFEDYQRQKDHLREVQGELSKYERQEDLPKYQIELETIKTKLLQMTEEVEIKKAEVEQWNEKREQYRAKEEARNRYKAIEEESKSLSRSYEELLRVKEKIEDWITINQEREEQLIHLDLLLDAKHEDLSQDEHRLQQYQELQAEQKKLSEDYADWYDVVESVSSKKGIPIEFMNYYLEGIKLTANDCLRYVYGDSLYIDETRVDEKTFSITYVKDGLKAGDIRGASQGEASFISLAISFAFLAQDIREYNIILLDEIDGVLDHEKKNRFLDILYARLHEIQCEQCFLITHSDIYNDQKVNLILTDDTDISRFHQPTIIHRQ